jgi:hypothetical protein
MAGKIVQLDLYTSEQEKKRVMDNEEFKKMVVKSIRGLFARYNEVEFAVLEMHKRIDQLTEAMINHG